MPFLEFKALALGADRLTKQWTVESKDIPLGIVAWTTSWRRYTFIRTPPRYMTRPV